MPCQRATHMPIDTIDGLRKALNCIRKENNRMKIRLNRYWTQVKICELVKLQLYNQAHYMQSFLADNIYKLDVNTSDEE